MDAEEVFLPGTVHLYDGARTDTLDLDEIARFVRSILPKADVLVLEDVISSRLAQLSGAEKEQEVAELARAFAAARVHDISAQQDVDSLLYGEVEYEKRRMLDTAIKSLGVLYDGQKLTSIYAGSIDENKLTVQNAQILFTNQLVGTWDDNDKRYHARVAVYGYPSIISTSGVVEAPARPREFYLKRQMGVDPIALKEEFRDTFVDYDDPRLTEVMKGYAAQALFYHMTGEPFCRDKTCRLYNAHWQEDLIQAQLTGDDFCPEHAAFLSRLTT
jgi:hypothetical protein